MEYIIIINNVSDRLTAFCSSATAAAGNRELLTVVLLSEASSDATTHATDYLTTLPPEDEATETTASSPADGETDTPSSLLGNDTTAAPSPKSPSSAAIFDSVCFDSPPLHVLPGIFETANDSWIVDDHGALHKLQPGDEFRVRQGVGLPDLVEVVVPSCPTIVYDDSIFTSTITTEVIETSQGTFYVMLNIINAAKGTPRYT